MKMVKLPKLGIVASAIGFGCASLGSRIGADRGTKSLTLAFECGVTWFDVAPPYGDGYAEGILGTFLKGRRQKIGVCTKVGIARPGHSILKSVARSLSRPVVKAFPNTRRVVSALRDSGRQPIDPASIEHSVVESLRQLKTDYIDLLALHEPSPEESSNDQIIAALQSIRQKGYARAIGIAGSPDSIIAGMQATDLFEVAQFSNNAFFPSMSNWRGNDKKNASTITHGVFGSQSLERFSCLLQQHPAIALDLEKKYGFPQMRLAQSLLLAHALASNADGIVVTSMFDARHLRMNCDIAAASIDASLVDDVEHVIELAAAR